MLKGLFIILNLSCLSLLNGQIPHASNGFTKLENFYNKDLELKLYNIVKANKSWHYLYKNKKLCFGVVDISDPNHPQYAYMNGRHMMYAASLPKIAILLAVMDAIDQSKIEMTEEVDALLHQMIRYSNNQASTKLMDLVGFENIKSTLEDDRFEFYDEEKSGGLWVGKRYGSGGKKYPEPIKGLSHAATVNQVCRYYYMLAYGKLINCDASEQMLEYMVDPGIHHKFVNTIERLAPNATVYRKSGSWKTYHADSILVLGEEWRNYILVGLVESENGEMILREISEKIDNLLETNLN